MMAGRTPAPAAPPTFACWMTKRALSGKEKWARRFFWVNEMGYLLWFKASEGRAIFLVLFV